MDQSAPNAPHDSGGLLNHLHRASLSYSGYSYIVGDLLLAAHGLLNKRPDRAFTGLTWGLGGLAMALYGHASPTQRLRIAAYDMADFMSREGIEISPDTALQRDFLSHRRETGTQIQQFMYRHPSQILNTVYLIGSATLIRSGLKQKLRDPWEMASGALVMGGALAGLVLPEREPSPDSHTTPLTPQWFLEKPLRLSATLYSLNNVTMLKSALHERANGLPGYNLKYGVVGSYLAANTLLGMSSKESDNDVMSHETANKLLDMAAEVIGTQPAEDRASTITRLSNYLAKHPDITQDQHSLETALRQRLPDTPTTLLSPPTTAERLTHQPTAQQAI